MSETSVEFGLIQYVNVVNICRTKRGHETVKEELNQKQTHLEKNA